VVTAGAVEVDVLLGDHAAADPAPKHVVKEVVEVEPWANNGLCGTLAKPVRQGIQHWRVLIHQAAEQCRKLGVGANVLNGCLPSQGLKRVEIRVIDTTYVGISNHDVREKLQVQKSPRQASWKLGLHLPCTY